MCLTHAARYGLSWFIVCVLCEPIVLLRSWLAACATVHALVVFPLSFLKEMSMWRPDLRQCGGGEVLCTEAPHFLEVAAVGHQ